MTPEERTKRARIAAYAMHKKCDPKARAAKIQATLRRRFEDEVDPDRTLPEQERERRAEMARKEHYSRLAYLSLKARTAKSK